MSVFITGDLHGEKDLIKSIPERCPELGAGDILIIAGDFGIPWWNPSIGKSWEDKKLLKILSEYEFTICFVDGNHENYDNLKRYSHEERWGGRVQQIGENVYHLCRGEIFRMDGYSVFAFGGATSVDKIYRTEHVSWWKEENASQLEKDHGLESLKAANWNVDYVITHTAPEQFMSVYQHAAFNKLLLHCPTQAYLTEIHSQLTYKKWYFGHFHDDVDSSYHKCRLLFDDIVKIGK